MVDSFSAPEELEDVSIDELRNEFEEKLIIEQAVITMEVDIEMVVPAVPPPKNTVSSRQPNPTPLQVVPDLPSSAHALLDTTPPSLSPSAKSLLPTPSLRASLPSK